MKLVFDIARIFFTRLAVLLAAAFILVGVDAYQARQGELRAAMKKLDSSLDGLGQAKQRLERALKQARDRIDKIDDQIEWWRRPHPPAPATPVQLAMYMAIWTIEHVQAIQRLEDERRELEKRIDSLTDDLRATGDRIAGIATAKLELLTKAQERGVFADLFNSNALLESLAPHKTTLTLIFLGLFFGPLSVKAINFYLLAPLARKATPITINPAQVAAAGEVGYGTPQKQASIDVDRADSLIVKPGWYSLNTEGRTRTRFFWDWRNPFASYAMGLVKMTEFFPESAYARELKLGSELDPNHDILAVHLRDHPGYVVKHGHVVATSGNALAMGKQWRIWDWRSWLFGNVRYVFFRGTGAVYIHGYGSVSINDTANPNHRIKERHVIAFDTRTSFRMIRTETFINYWLNEKPLYDISFAGQGGFVQQQSFGARDEKIFRSLLEDILGSVGKILGF